MADIFTRVKRSAVMSRIRSHGNKSTEASLAKLFRSQKICGWRRQMEIRGGQKTKFRVKPDFVFGKQKLAVFVDGCFWHGCPRHGHQPRDNRKFWKNKFARNQARDRFVNRTLRRLGWRIIRIWECSLKRHPETCIKRLQRALK